jgi:hypothetical protein
LTFEWILVITVLVIGVVGGMSAARDALLTELGDVAEGIVSLDQSYSILNPWDVSTPDCPVDGASDSSYTDGASYHQGRLSKGPETNTQCTIGDCDRYGDTERPYR